jgi:transposase
MFPQLPAAVRVFLCARPTDMRKSFDGLLGMVHEFVGQDPLSGHLCLFLNRRCDRVKILFWERDGLVIWYKRLEAGTFQKLDPAASADRSRSQSLFIVFDRPAWRGGFDLTHSGLIAAGGQRTCPSQDLGEILVHVGLRL